MYPTLTDVSLTQFRSRWHFRVLKLGHTRNLRPDLILRSFFATGTLSNQVAATESRNFATTAYSTVSITTENQKNDGSLKII